MINFEIKNNDSLAICGRKNQSGRSMIEMLGVLAIIGVLSVGGIAGYSKAMMKYRINKSIEQITLIAGNIRAFWGPQKNYEGVVCYPLSFGHSGLSLGDGCPIHKKAKIFPDDMFTVEDGKSFIFHPFGDAVSLEKCPKTQLGNDQAFRITYFGLPQEACIELATHDWSTAGASVIRLNSLHYKTPVDIDIVTQKCVDDYNEISLHFDVDVNSTYWKELLKN